MGNAQPSGPREKTGPGPRHVPARPQLQFPMGGSPSDGGAREFQRAHGNRGRTFPFISEFPMQPRGVFHGPVLSLSRALMWKNVPSWVRHGVPSTRFTVPLSIGKSLHMLNISVT